MIKIFIDKNEAVPSVVEKVLISPDSDIVVVVPKDSEFKKAENSFGLLKREADSRGKTVRIESVDDEVLSLAQASGIDAIHSLFKQEAFHRSLSDIVSSSQAGGEAQRAASKKASVRTEAKRKKSREETPTEIQVTANRAEPARTSTPQEPPREEAQTPTPLTPQEAKISPEMWKTSGRSLQEEVESVSRRRFRIPLPSFRSSRLLIFSIVFVMFLGITLWVTAAFFSRAEIVLAFKRTPWEYQGNFSVLKTIGKPDSADGVLPGELFQEKKNVVMLSPATGKTATPQKAKGKIIIWNAYGTASQQLVATTRFETPEGKIFRLDKAATVPGATITRGELLPSRIEAAVTADQPGPEYNVGQIPKLTIPGFKGTPRYEGFYGEIKEPTTGGSTGERAIPTDEDLTTAKTKTIEVLRTALETNLTNGVPPGFAIPQGASDIQITKLTVDQNVDAGGKFSVFGEAKLAAIGFREEDLRAVLEEMIQKENPRGLLKNPRFSYTATVPDFQAGKLTFTLAAEADVISEFDVAAFSSQLPGKRIEEVRELVNTFEGSVEAKLWPPFFVTRIPASPDRITVVVN